MRRRWIPLLAAFMAVQATAATVDPNAAFADVAKRYFAEKMALDPLTASATLALPQYEGRLAITFAPAEIAKASALSRRTLRALDALPAGQLRPAQRLSHELLRWEVQLALDGDRFAGHLMPIDQFGGLPLALANLGSGDQAQPLKTPADYDNYLKRLQRLPAVNRQAIANMREGMRRGITVPRALIEAALPTFKSLAEADFDQSPFAAAVQRMPESFSATQRQRITAAYRGVFTSRLLPSLRGLVSFLQGPYLRACRTSAGIDALPDGAAWYAHLVRLHTTTTMTPEQIHALGLAEVQRIHGEIAKVQAHYGFKGSVTEFLKWHADEPRFRPYTTWPQILQGYETLNTRVLPQLPKLFGRTPKLPMELREMPALQRASTSPYYNPPAPDGSRPGIFFVGAPVEPPAFNNSIMTTLLLHEGQPGHHYHTALQYELDLPDFRKYGWNTAFGEGWALYAETLGREMGLYDDPNQYLGHLKLELLRAVRLVTDTGLHAKGWTREQSIRYMIDTEGTSETFARQATERYMAAPGQALAYKVGSMKIQQLRERAQRALGERFSLAAFHDLVLSQGTVPLAVLERMVDEWIAAAVRTAAAQ